MLNEEIFLKMVGNDLIAKYKIKKVTLFGSRASGSNRSNSDVDLIIEFHNRITLLALSKLRLQLEELLELKVDIVHGPLREDDIIETKETIVLYNEE